MRVFSVSWQHHVFLLLLYHKIKTNLSKYWGPICICIFFVLELHQRVFSIPSSSTMFSHAWISFQFLLIIHLFTDLTTPEKQLIVHTKVWSILLMIYHNMPITIICYICYSDAFSWTISGKRTCNIFGNFSIRYKLSIGITLIYTYVVNW